MSEPSNTNKPPLTLEDFKSLWPEVVAEFEATLDDYIEQYEGALREHARELTHSAETHAWDEKLHPRGKGGQWGEGRSGKPGKSERDMPGAGPEITSFRVEHENDRAALQMVAKLNEKEFKTIQKFQGDTFVYRENSALREGQRPSDQARTLVGAFKKMPTHDGDVWRGLNFNSRTKADEYVQKLKPGVRLVEPGFMSTSISRTEALEFATRGHIDERHPDAFGVLLHITGAKDGVAIWRVAQDDVKPEREVAFAPGKQMRVTEGAVAKLQGYHVVEVTG